MVSVGLVSRCVPRFEEDHGRVGGARGGESVEALVHLGPPLPQPIALLALRSAGAYRALRLALEADDRVRAPAAESWRIPRIIPLGVVGFCAASYLVAHQRLMNRTVVGLPARPLANLSAGTWNGPLTPVTLFTWSLVASAVWAFAMYRVVDPPSPLTDPDPTPWGARAETRAQAESTFTSIFPMLSPRSSPMKASGALSMPSTMVSRKVKDPSANQPPTSRSKSAPMSR